MAELASCTIYIKGIPTETTEADVRDACSQYGNITDVAIPEGKDFCFVEFAEEAQAQVRKKKAKREQTDRTTPEDCMRALRCMRPCDARSSYTSSDDDPSKLCHKRKASRRTPPPPLSLSIHHNCFRCIRFREANAKDFGAHVAARPNWRPNCGVPLTRSSPHIIVLPLRGWEVVRRTLGDLSAACFFLFFFSFLPSS